MAQPRLRVDGELIPLDESTITVEQIEDLLAEALAAGGRPADALAGEVEADWGITLAGIGRFRVHAYRQRGTWALVLRGIATSVPDWDALRLPRGAASWVQARDGLVIVVGPTGSGKSTTLASLVDIINSSRACHILMIEDPVEYDLEGIVQLARGQTREGAHVLDLFKEFGTHLADQGVAELAPQTSDVAAKGGVELVEIVGHDAQPTELDPAAVRVIDPRQKLRGGWAGPRGYPTRPCSGRARSPRPQPSPPPEGQRTLGCRADRRR